MYKGANYETSLQEGRKILSVLIVDDEETAGILEKIIDQQLGRKVVATKCNKKKLNKLSESNFDLILLDINISDDNWIDTISEIRKTTDNANIIVMTNNTNREIEQQAREQSVIYYMVKPFEPYELISIIRHLLRRKTNRVN